MTKTSFDCFISLNVKCREFQITKISLYYHIIINQMWLLYRENSLFVSPFWLLVYSLEQVPSDDLDLMILINNDINKCRVALPSKYSTPNNREVKFDVYGKRQTANGKLLPSVFSSLYSRIKIFVFAVNSKRHFSIFVWFIQGYYEKNRKTEVILQS